jgi:mannan endo-1,4-beta-mannosidase
MESSRKTILLVISFLFSGIVSFGQHQPVTPNASPEAQALLELFYSISGKYMLSGQHNYPNIKDRNTLFAADFIGKTPAIFSTDWGFAKDSDTDSHLARPDIVKEAIRQHQLGSIITICWHAVPPTTNEPVTFRQMPGSSPDSLISVQGQLTDQQFKDLLTPGTKLYKHWCEQVDTIAFYLKQLQAAHVPILWRPYHEMNGNWFWWGGRHGEYSTRRLYKQLFDRLVNYHKINNLVWIWSLDRPAKPERQFSYFYPGNEYLDILAIDIYGNDFNKLYYDSLLALSKGKPVVLGEVGNPPAPEIIKAQPQWAYYVTWAGMVRNLTRKQYDDIMDTHRVLSLEDSAYNEVSKTYRSICNISNMENVPTNFSGNWIFNEEMSELANSGASGLPYKMSISQKGNNLIIQKTIVPEFVENQIIVDTISIDGKEFKSASWHSSSVTTYKWSEKKDAILVQTKTNFTIDGKKAESTTTEKWELSKCKKFITIEQNTSSPRGDKKIKMVYRKQKLIDNY